MERPQKVAAHIVRDGCLPVFVHADDEQFDQSGLQVPAGAVRDGEPPEQAVPREAFEETGPHGLRVERCLGSAEWDMRPYGE